MRPVRADVMTWDPVRIGAIMASVPEIAHWLVAGLQDIHGRHPAHYAPAGSAYSLYFEQPVFLLRNPGTREIVMYNKLDEHVILSHAAWNLTGSPESLAGAQGWFTVHDAPRPHWRYFWFD